MNFGFDPTLVQYHHDYRRKLLTQEYQLAADQQRRLVAKAAQLYSRIRHTFSKRISGMGEGGTGSLQPSV